MSALAYLPAFAIGLLLPIACLRAAWLDRRKARDVAACLMCCWPLLAVALVVWP